MALHSDVLLQPGVSCDSLPDLPRPLLRPHSQSGYVDMDKLEEKAMEYRPKMIICGASAYPRDWDYKRFREIADKVRRGLLGSCC
jgi:hypothetical protein